MNAQGKIAKVKAPPENARKHILDAAAKLFAEHGYVATTMRDIAEETGIKAGSIYYHFSAKEQLLDEVMRIGVERVFDQVKIAVNSLPPESSVRAKLAAAIHAHLFSALALGHYTKVNIRCTNTLPEAIRQHYKRTRRPYERYWRQLIQAGVDNGEIEASQDSLSCSLYIFGFMNWTIEWYREGKFDLEEVSRRYADTLFDGIGRRATAGPGKPATK